MDYAPNNPGKNSPQRIQYGAIAQEGRTMDL